MLWQKLNATAQSILLNFQELIFECVQQTNPDKNYYAEKQEGDFYNNTLGLYNGATLEAYRKQGLLTALMINAVKNAPTANYVVAQLMAAQNARGVCDKLGFKEYAHFIPLCYGFDLNAILS